VANIDEYAASSGRIIDENGNVINIASVIDTSKNAVVGLTAMQKAVMDEKMFLGFVKYSVTVGNTEYLQIKTGSSAVCFYVISIQTDSEKIMTKFIEDPTVTDGTAAVSLTNMNRESSEMCSVSAYSDPSGVSGGTQLDEIYAGGTIGQKVISGEQITEQNPWRLAANTDYIVSFTNDGTGDGEVVFRFVIIED